MHIIIMTQSWNLGQNTIVLKIIYFIVFLIKKKAYIKICFFEFKKKSVILTKKWQCFAVTDLDECKSNINVCPQPSVCYNTYGGYRCVCNGTDLKESQSCTSGKIYGRNVLNTYAW